MDTSTSSVPKHMLELQQFLSKTISEAGRAVVRSTDRELNEMHSDDFYLYLFLYSYFKKKSISQKKVDAISIDRSIATILLHKILLPNLVSGPSAKKYTALDEATAKKTDYYPLLPQRTIRETMSSNRVTLEAFSEVIEICNHVDGLQGHKKAGFGVVNLLHFVAIAITLVATDGVEENLSLVLDDADLPAAIKYKIVYIWSLVDVANAKVLTGVCDRILQNSTQKGYAFIDVSALPPLLMNGLGQVNAPAPTRSGADNPTTSSSSTVGGISDVNAKSHVGVERDNALSASESEDEEGSPKPSASFPSVYSGPRVVHYSENAEESTGQQVDGEPKEKGGGDDDFWVRLAS